MEFQPFTCTLGAAESYSLGEPVLVTFTITNSGDETYQLLAWDTPLGGQALDFLTVRRDEEQLPYDGRLVKRGDPVDANYLTLAPGESRSGEVDISELYPIDQPGEYTATLNTTLYDAFPVPGAIKQPPRSRLTHEPHRLDPTSVTFTVVADGEPRLTAGQTARKATLLAADLDKDAKGKAPKFNGGTASQQADTAIAHDNAQKFAALSAGQLRTTPGAGNALYKEWFGAFDQARYDTVAKHFADISHVLETEQVTYDLTGTGCQPSYYAYTHKGDRTVWLCNGYLNAAHTGTDSKFGTLVHEWSHAVSSTDDNAYGQSACRDLANTDTTKATNNADSHEYFAEAVQVIQTSWWHGVPGAASNVPVAPGTSPTSWYTTPENVQHIAYAGTDQKIHELFFHIGGDGRWLHNYPGMVSNVPVAPGTSPTSWYTTPENVQHIAYVGTDQRIHELFYFIGGENRWFHNVPGAASDVLVAPGTSPTSWYTTPENVQHIAYVGTDQRIHELFFFIGGNQWFHSVPGAVSDVPVAQGTSPTSWYTTPENVQHIGYVGTDQRIHELFFFIGGNQWFHGQPGAASDVPVAPGTSPTSWYTTPENVQHIGYVGTDQKIHELFFFIGGDGRWLHNVPGRVSDVPVVAGTSPTSWYTTPENVQHIGYVGTDQRIHELFYFIR